MAVRIGGTLLGVSVLVGAVTWGGDLWNDLEQESQQEAHQARVVFYNATEANPVSDVYTEPKPKDCDWDFAPLGNKGCYYQKQQVKEDLSFCGEVKDVSCGTQSRTNERYLPYDRGKTWHRPGEGAYFTWVKVQN